MNRQTINQTNQGKLTAVASPLLQRKCACGTHTPGGGSCHACSKNSSATQVQRKADDKESSNESPPIVHEALRSSGQPLDEPTRAFFEPSFGQDFSHVRVHTDAQAAAAAQAVNALAYTVGHDIVFGAGRYSPATGAGRHLLAHELTHTIQQGTTGQRFAGKLAIGDEGDPSERQADIAAQSIVSGAKAPPLSQINGSFIQRAPANEGFPTPRHGSTLPYREAKELTDCIRIMGEGSRDYCRQEVLGKPAAKAAPAKTGSFAVNMTPYVTGLEGTIEFTPDAKACPICKKIRLLQLLRISEKPGVDYKWPGAEAEKEKVKTKEDKTKGIKPDFFVDHKAAGCQAGKKCSPYYRDHWANPTHSQDGSNDGVTPAVASLWDRPRGDAEDIFEFETCARCDDTGEYLRCVNWGFTADATGKATASATSEQASPSATFTAGVADFDKFYGN